MNVPGAYDINMPRPLLLRRDEPTIDYRPEFVDALQERSAAARGALTGVLLGLGLWSAIIVFVFNR